MIDLTPHDVLDLIVPVVIVTEMMRFFPNMNVLQQCPYV